MAHPSATAALDAVVAQLPAGVSRPGQVAMLEAVADAMAHRRHLLVEAGTGTGKSMAYLVPAVIGAIEARDSDDGETGQVVVSTATKALQEQLVGEDLPFLAGALADLGVRFRYAMLKGRANYLCVAKTAAALQGLDQLDEEATAQAGDHLVEELAWWSWTTTTGDRSDHPRQIPDHVWAKVSTDAVECPGAVACPFGEVCFAETARRRASAADVVVVNAHLYALHLETGGSTLPAHRVVVLDEAHVLRGRGRVGLRRDAVRRRVRNLARRVRQVITGDLAEQLESVAADLDAELNVHEPERALPGTGALAVVIARVRDLVRSLTKVLEGIHPTTEETVTRHQLATRLATALRGDCEVVLKVTDPAGDHVSWVERARANALLRVAPVDVGPLIAGRLNDDVTLVATSATLSVAGDFAPTAWRLGLRDQDAWTGLHVDSPFDYANQALLYCPVHIPDPRAPGYVEAMLDELEALTLAAGGRTLALFTSKAAMSSAASALRPRLDGIEVLVQDELPRPELVRRLRGGDGVAVFATQSFWQGVDIPGSALSLVTIDKLPFPRPTDPLFQARRDAARAAGVDPFATVDLPRAAVLLAQGTGRLIRSDADRGVVAVFDRRLAFARYAWTLVNSLPPMRRTRHRAEAVAFLHSAAR